MRASTSPSDGPDLLPPEDRRRGEGTVQSSGSRWNLRLRPHHRPSAGPHLEGRRLAPDPTAVLLVAFDLAAVALALLATRYG